MSAFRYSLLLFFLLILLGCSPSEKEKNKAQYLSLHWELVENQVQPKQRHVAKLVVSNTGTVPLTPNWKIFFNTIFLSLSPEILSGEVVIEHLSGDFFQLVPKENFPVLQAGESHEIIYASNSFLTKNSHAPHGLYVVFEGEDAGIPIDQFKVKPFTLAHQLQAVAGTNVPIPGHDFLFAQNANLSFIKPHLLSPIIPTPKNYHWGEGFLELKGDISIDAGPFKKEVAHFINLLQGHYAGNIRMVENAATDISLGISDQTLEKEAYHLSVGEGIRIAASNESGAFYALQSLLALLPWDFFSGKQESLLIPNIEIRDQPRFAHRGLFLDVARNFQSKEAVLKLLDLMAFYKLNVFHINLANDEGWRIEIPGLPELTAIGSKRGHSPTETDYLWPYYGSGPDWQNSPNGTGYYTVSDFKEILRYAQDRHIEVIPEIGVPAHSRAAIIAMRKRYHQKMKDGDQEGALEYLLEDFEDTSTYLSAQNFRGNTICICQESAFRFYEKVVDEIIAMYRSENVPIQTFHTGGDEVPNGVWTQSPVCREFIEASPEINSVHDLSNYFYTRISKMFEEKGLQTAGWEEIGQMELEEGGRQTVRPNPAFAEAGFRVYAWNAVAGWGGEDMAYQLANAGYEVIICNSSNIYFDLAYNLDPDEPGHEWSGYVDLKAAWKMVPFNNFISNDSDMYGRPIDPEELAKGKVRLTDRGKSNIKGIQGQLWTETVKGQDMMEYYLLPKMLGLVERAWAADPEWAGIADVDSRLPVREAAWNSFANAVGQRELPRLDHLFGGFNTRLPKPGAIIEGGLLHANVETPGLQVRYTRDGTEPDMHSPLYTAPMPIDGKIYLKAFTPSGQSGGISIIEKKHHH
ncbi:MAG: family 20 glycosylhydrolase [Cecembia sp.]